MPRNKSSQMEERFLVTTWVLQQGLEADYNLGTREWETSSIRHEASEDGDQLPDGMLHGFDVIL
jgi:hypothetical protein